MRTIVANVHNRRNQPYHCGSSKKYERCHGAYTAGVATISPEIFTGIEQKLKELKATHIHREQQQASVDLLRWQDLATIS